MGLGYGTNNFVVANIKFNKQIAGQPYLAPIKFFNSRTIPRCIVESEQIAEPTEIVAMKKDQQKQLQQLNEIIYGIVSRFCVSADPELCLSIMNQAHKGMHTFENRFYIRHIHNIRELGIDHNLPLLMHIFEETLHSFFVHTTHSDALDAAARAVDMSASVSWNALVQARVKEYFRNYLSSLYFFI